MKNSPRAYVVFAGGLGNQLFQASALFGLNSNYQKFWLKGASNPRNGLNGLPESLTLLDLPNRSIPLIFERFLQKVVNLNLKNSVPDLAGIKRTPRARVAERRTFPETTQVPIKFTISVIARESRISPTLPPITALILLCKSISGCGPDATPPKPLIGAPSGRISE